jgi:hypothetical protein
MFKPDAFNFVALANFQLPGGVAVYEYANHPRVDGKPDFLRINAYLSMDGAFVTVWRGLVEPLLVDAHLGSVNLPDDFDFRSTYTEELFRGWIETAEAARHILAALQLDEVPPQVLSSVDGELRCDPIGS